MPALLHRTALAASLLAVALAAGATTADASTIEGDSNLLTYKAAAGEDNGLVLIGMAGSPARIRFSDAGDATITAWPDGLCEPIDNDVQCSVPAEVRVELGDLDDSFTMYEDKHAHGLRVEGGPGDDELGGQQHPRPKTLVGGPGNDLLKPEQGDDVLLGGPGDDILWGDEGNDELRGEEGDDQLKPDNGKTPGNDIVDGGPGFDYVDDWLELSKKSFPQLSISLDGVANDGRPGETDNVFDVERSDPKVSGRFVLSDGPDEWQIMANMSGGNSTVLAGGGDDRITGEDHDETIDGGAGNDVLEGGLRDDTITGGSGRDTILGDESDTGCTWAPEYCLVFGNDTIDARDGEVDNINCGPGTDRVLVDPIDVHAGCETVETGGPVQDGGGPGGPGGDGGGPGGGGPQGTTKMRIAPVKVRLGRALRKGITVRLSGARPGRTTVTAKRGTKAVGSGRGTVSEQGTATIRVRFTRAARRGLRRARTVRLRLSAAGTTAPLTLRR